ncbi:hypothetical protein EDD21DRAFT_430252 [Dissophora ornata]|nr:hypothetical protein EDD21DRAFT_430252 [Dissophora ornata]
MANAAPRWQHRNTPVIALLGIIFFMAVVHLELIPDLEFNLETHNSGVDSQVNLKSSSVSTPFSPSLPESRPNRPPGDQELFLGYLAPITLDNYRVMTPEERERDCRVYHSWTLTPWISVFDIQKVVQRFVGIGGLTEPIRVLDRPNVTIAWMAEHLGITDQDKEVYWLNSTTHWDFQILGDSEVDYGLHPEGNPDLRSYSKELLL